MKKSDAWLYLIGGILAIVFGIIHFYKPAAWIPWLLFIVGIIVGFFAIQEKELKPMLWATLLMVLVSYFGSAAFAANMAVIGNILTAFLFVYVPAAVVILMKYPFIKK